MNNQRSFFIQSFTNISNTIKLKSRKNSGQRFTINKEILSNMIISNQISFQFKLAYILFTMYKAQEIKRRKHLAKDAHHLKQKNAKNSEKQVYQTSSSKYLINIKTQRPTKSSDKNIPEKDKIYKPKKIKFITEQIQKSNNNLQQTNPKSYEKKCSILLSQHNCQEEIVEKTHRSNKKSQTKKDKIEKKEGDKNNFNINVDPGKITKRKENSKIKNMNMKMRSPRKVPKSTKKLIVNNKHKNNLNNRRFLSPQLVKQQNSLYFSNCKELDFKLHHNTLAIPKKESRYIFQSNNSTWQNNKKGIMNSTLDFLN